MNKLFALLCTLALVLVSSAASAAPLGLPDVPEPAAADEPTAEELEAEEAKKAEAEAKAQAEAEAKAKADAAAKAEAEAAAATASAPSVRVSGPKGARSMFIEFDLSNIKGERKSGITAWTARTGAKFGALAKMHRSFRVPLMESATIPMR